MAHPRRGLPSAHSARRPVLIAIVGGSGSGKSWLAERLLETVGVKALRLSLDDFYRDRSHLSPARRARLNFDHPRAIDWPAFERALLQLSKGRTVRVPRYDFSTHSRRARWERLQPRALILVEGLWLLKRPAIRQLFGLRLFLECPTSVQLRRRLARDLASRGRSRASVLAQFRNTVQPMQLRHVTPQARWADAILSGQMTGKDLRSLIARVRQLL